MTFAADKEEASLVYCGNLESDKKTEKRLRHSNGGDAEGGEAGELRRRNEKMRKKFI